MRAYRFLSESRLARNEKTPVGSFDLFDFGFSEAEFRGLEAAFRKKTLAANNRRRCLDQCYR
jgi:hypothetical protein